MGQERAYEAVFDDERETLPREPMQGAAVGAGKEAAWASQVADLRRQLQLKDAQIASVERRLEVTRPRAAGPVSFCGGDARASGGQLYECAGGALGSRREERA